MLKIWGKITILRARTSWKEKGKLRNTWKTLLNRPYFFNMALAIIPAINLSWGAGAPSDKLPSQRNTPLAF